MNLRFSSNCHAVGCILSLLRGYGLPEFSAASFEAASLSGRGYAVESVQDLTFY
jgi:hypothetical protein